MKTPTENKTKNQTKQTSLPAPERRALLGKLGKVAVIAPVATFLYDASNNAANAE